MTTSVERDVLHRALVELQTWAAPSCIKRQQQRVQDLETEVMRKLSEVRELEARRDDLQQAVTLALRDPEMQGIAFGFTDMIYILNEEIDRTQPVGQQRKLQQARQELQRMHSVAQALDEVGARG